LWSNLQIQIGPFQLSDTKHHASAGFVIEDKWVTTSSSIVEWVSQSHIETLYVSSRVGRHLDRASIGNRLLPPVAATQQQCQWLQTKWWWHFLLFFDMKRCF
jgi:hypothetical protein